MEGMLGIYIYGEDVQQGWSDVVDGKKNMPTFAASCVMDLTGMKRKRKGEEYKGKAKRYY